MKVIIDRFEGEHAVVEIEKNVVVTVPRALFPKEAQEGSVIHITCAEEDTDRRRAEMKQKMESLFGAADEPPAKTDL